MTVGDWDRRDLCPDGACIGVIGPAGTCKVCGRVAPNWGEERMRGLQDSDESSAPADDARTTSDPIEPSAPASIGAWTGRTLCSDGACIGVIGADGRCTVCGKLAGVSTDDDDEDEDEDEDEDDAAEPGRRLCPDGACIGVIGADGTCKVCGKAAT